MICTKPFLAAAASNALVAFAFLPPPSLSSTEVVSIVAAYQLSGYKCFDYYYREAILKTLPCFPEAPTSS